MQRGMNWLTASFLKTYLLSKTSQISGLHGLVVGVGPGDGVGGGVSQYDLFLSTTCHLFAMSKHEEIWPLGNRQSLFLLLSQNPWEKKGYHKLKVKFLKSLIFTFNLLLFKGCR